MAEKMQQCLMLLLVTLSCYGYFRIFSKVFKLANEFSVFVTFTLIGLVMMLAGILNILVPAAYIIFAGGLIADVFLIIKKDSLKNFVSPGTIFFAFGTALLFVILYEAKLTHVDNFSHWGAILKFIFAGDSLPKNSPLVYFPAYPTGSSLFIYYFSKIVGIRAEWFWCFVQGVYLVSCAATLFSFAKSKTRLEQGIIYAAVIVVAASILCANIDFADLLVDSMLPMTCLAGLLMCVYYKDSIEEKTAPLTIVAAFLPTIKNSGYLFSAYIIALIVLLQKKKNIKQPLVLGASLLVVNRLWSMHVKAAFANGFSGYHALSAQNLGNVFAEKTTEDLIAITQAVTKRWLTHGRLIWVVLAFAAVLIVIKCAGNRRELKQLAFYAIGAYVIYLIGLLGMYFFSMSAGEARGAAAFDRYYSTILILEAGFLFIITLIAASEAGESKKKNICVLLSVVLMIMLCAPDYSYYIPQRMREPSNMLVLRNKMEKLVDDYEIYPEMSYGLFTSEENEISARVFCTYLLWPQNTVVYTDADIVNGTIPETAVDYYLLIDESAVNREYLNKLGKIEPAGFIY